MSQATTTRKKHATITPEARQRAELVQAHVRRVLEAANAGEIPIPVATRARVIVQQTIDFLNQRLTGIKTVDQHVKAQVQAAIGVIRESFIENEVPKPQTIIDNWVGHRVQFKVQFKKKDEYQLAIDQLNALPAIDEETRVAVEETVAGFEKLVR